MAKMIKIAQTGDLAPGTGKVVEAEGLRIALFHVEGAFSAIDNTCPHRGGPLGEGELTGEIVTCPWHGAALQRQDRRGDGPAGPSRGAEPDGEGRGG